LTGLIHDLERLAGHLLPILLLAVGQHGEGLGGRLLLERAHLLHRGGAVVADLSEVTFLDSSGLGVLVQAHRTATERDTRLLVVASPPVRKLLALTGLDTVLDTYDQLSAAEAALSNGEAN